MENLKLDEEYLVVVNTQGEVFGVFTKDNDELADKLAFKTYQSTGYTTGIQLIKLNTTPTEDLKALSEMVFARKMTYAISSTGLIDDIKPDSQTCLIHPDQLDTFEVDHILRGRGLRDYRFEVHYYHNLPDDPNIEDEKILNIVREWKMSHLDEVW